jgi:hypothetical protein
MGSSSCCWRSVASSVTRTPAGRSAVDVPLVVGVDAVAAARADAESHLDLGLYCGSGLAVRATMSSSAGRAANAVSRELVTVEARTREPGHLVVDVSSCHRLPPCESRSGTSSRRCANWWYRRCSSPRTYSARLRHVSARSTACRNSRHSSTVRAYRRLPDFLAPAAGRAQSRRRAAVRDALGSSRVWDLI